jgi:Autotransporter beta-domain
LAVWLNPIRRDLSGAGDADGRGHRPNVTGTATLGGATVNAAFANGSFISKQYTILTAAGGVSGTFASNITNTNLPQNFSDTLSYDATHAFLNLTLGFAGPNFNSGLNVNQQNVANALTNFFNANGGFQAVYGTLTPAGLTQASGELGTGSQQTTFDAMNLFMGTMLDPSNRGTSSTPGGGASFYASEGDANGYASTQNSGAAHDAYAMFTKAPPAVTPFEQRWKVWAAGFGGSQTTDGNATLGSNTATSSVYGTVVGADYRISPFTVAGFALAGGGTNFSVAGSGSGHSDLFQAGAFVPGLHLGSTCLWLAGHHHQPHRDRGRHQSTPRRVRRQCVFGSPRRRLSLCRAVGRRHRHHALRRRAVHHLRSAGLCRAGHRRLQRFCAGLWRQGRHRHAQRTRYSHRQILGDDRRHSDAARPRGLGA